MNIPPALIGYIIKIPIIWLQVVNTCKKNNPLWGLNGFIIRNNNQKTLIMKRQSFNHRAIWLCIVLSQAIPLLWYSIFSGGAESFGNIINKYLEVGMGSWLFVASIVGAVVAFYFMAWMFIQIPVDSGQGGLIAGSLIGATFHLVSLMSAGALLDDPVWFAIGDTVANVLVFGLAGLILGEWRHYEYLDKGVEVEEDVASFQEN